MTTLTIAAAGEEKDGGLFGVFGGKKKIDEKSRMALALAAYKKGTKGARAPPAISGRLRCLSAATPRVSAAAAASHAAVARRDDKSHTRTPPAPSPLTSRSPAKHTVVTGAAPPRRVHHGSGGPAAIGRGARRRVHHLPSPPSSPLRCGAKRLFTATCLVGGDHV